MLRRSSFNRNLLIAFCWISLLVECFILRGSPHPSLSLLQTSELADPATCAEYMLFWITHYWCENLSSGAGLSLTYLNLLFVRWLDWISNNKLVINISVLCYFYVFTSDAWISSLCNLCFFLHLVKLKLDVWFPVYRTDWNMELSCSDLCTCDMPLFHGSKFGFSTSVKIMRFPSSESWESGFGNFRLPQWVQEKPHSISLAKLHYITSMVWTAYESHSNQPIAAHEYHK